MKGEVDGKRKAKAKAKKKGEVKEKELIFGLSEKQIIVFLLEFMAVSFARYGPSGAFPSFHRNLLHAQPRICYSGGGFNRNR